MAEMENKIKDINNQPLDLKYFTNLLLIIKKDVIAKRKPKEVYKEPIAKCRTVNKAIFSSTQNLNFKVFSPVSKMSYAIVVLTIEPPIQMINPIKKRAINNFCDFVNSILLPFPPNKIICFLSSFFHLNFPIILGSPPRRG